MAEVTSNAFFTTLQENEDAGKKSFGLCCTEAALLEDLAPHFRRLSTHPLQDYVHLSQLVLSANKNAILTDLRSLSLQNDLIILISTQPDGYKLCFDHLQLCEKSFSALTLRNSISFGDISHQMQDLANPWMMDQTIVGLQKHLSGFTGSEFDNLRLVSLAQTQNDLKEVEPLLRRADLIDVDISCCQSGERAIGLTAQEVCQLTHYAGRGTSAKILSIQLASRHSWDLECAATAIWYMLYGMTMRQEPVMKKMRQYTLTSAIEGRKLTFLFDANTQHWWCNTSPSEDEEKLIPCSYRDYEMASEKQEISDRLQYLLSLK
ncbi:MAG: hypothetical protein KTR24_02235 [Saprospiraceae bacterium]|nr:hypothetical protein [Saprospiraceae bacterium]